MLSEEKIKKMIRLSEYEKGQGSIDLSRTKYLKADYIRLQVLKSVVSVIAAVLLSLLLVIMYHMEYVMAHALNLPYGKLGIIIGSVFLVVVTISIIISWHMSSKNYEKSKMRVKEYYVTLQELLKIYEEDQKQEDES